MPRLARSVLRCAVAVALTTGATALAFPTAAHASPPTIPCTGANRGQIVTEVDSAQVDPVLTQFKAINIDPGTTGEITETLSVMETVTTTVGASAEISSSAGALLAKVSVKIGFTVQHVTSNTSTETTTMRWTFSQPGYYGLYKGTRKVSGRFQNWQCITKSSTSTGGFWGISVPINGTPYTTFDSIEVGTIRCGEPAPPGSLRLVAHQQLGC
ncbi:hypothetical protein Rhe02_18960 [Rhizocola hellebori]|uniref:Secreted protein n=1 Tax=Rhizocola hellebori TaxID=1392758 RepID=A0A8J3Q5K8_9ACTN|nr:hypothetical protein [Rhizocola hellebori]GIH03829.1 hypothetical protein Rhe02_18960 [Rhizocola hellebori]